MKLNRSTIVIFVVMVVLAALYRLVPERPLGFAPQIAMALFGGAVIKDRKFAFALPLLSMFISDLLYELAYTQGWLSMQGFYEGQFTNYVLFAGLTLIGFLLRDLKVFKIVAATIVGPTLFFLVSNFFVWLEGAGLNRPKTWDGLVMCYTDAVPFYEGSLVSTVFFSVVLFGGYFFINGMKEVKKVETAG